MNDASQEDGVTIEPAMRPPVKPRRRWWRRLPKWGAIAGILAFVGVVNWGWYVTRQLQAEIARIRDAGEPLTFKDLEAGRPELEEDQDAGAYYNAGMALVRAKGVAEALDSYKVAETQPASQPSVEQREQARKILDRNKLAFEMFDRGAALPFEQFSMDAQYGIGPSMEKVGTIRCAFRLLSLRTRETVREGKADSGTEEVVSSFAALRIFRPQPTVIVHMVGVACRALLLSDVQAVLNLPQVSEESLARLQRVVQESWNDNEVERMLLAERVYSIADMRWDLMTIVDEQLAAKLVDGGAEPSMPPGSWLNPFPRHMGLGLLKDMDRLLQASKRPWPEIVNAVNDPGLARSTMGEILVPSLARGIVLTGRSLAHVRSTAVAIMVRRHLIKHGKLPDTLAELVPEYTDALSADPFTGKPLIYKQEPGGYVVYSVDEDLQDDGGRFDRDKPEDRIDYGTRVRVSQRP